jgi:hypothetical protein
MPEQLDTLIGFATVMSVVSLLITTITQMVSAALGLRGKNLTDALQAMFYKIDSTVNQQVGDLAKKLSDEVLTQGILSDSALSMSKNWPTIWKRASAIRHDELFMVLKDIAGTTTVPPGAPKTPSEAAAKLLALLNRPTPATTAALAAVQSQLPALAAEKGTKLIEELNAATNVSLSNLEKWFNSALDRAQQWFTTHARIVTISASLVAALVLQLDALRMVQHAPAESGANGAFGGPWSWSFMHLLGMLASAALLSLGAPFWFNTLKTLTNLRPSLAAKVDNNPTQASAKPNE